MPVRWEQQKAIHANQVEFPLITPIIFSRNVGAIYLSHQAGTIRGWVASLLACLCLGSSVRARPLFLVGLPSPKPVCVCLFVNSFKCIPLLVRRSSEEVRLGLCAMPKCHTSMSCLARYGKSTSKNNQHIH